MSRPENIGLDASDGDNDLLLPSFRGLSFSIGFYTSSFFQKHQLMLGFSLSRFNAREPTREKDTSRMVVPWLRLLSAEK